jgi:hypothetical protein
MQFSDKSLSVLSTVDFKRVVCAFVKQNGLVYALNSGISGIV